MMLTSRLARRPVLALAGLALAAVIATAGPAHANVNTVDGGPYTKYDWGDCTIYVGSVKTWNGAAVGGADIWCNSVRGKIIAQVSLFRFTPSTGWQNVATSGWVSVYNTKQLIIQTWPPICGGSARWYSQTTVHVDGYQTSPIPSPSKIYDPIYC